jgi:hypothetical protein
VSSLGHLRSKRDFAGQVDGRSSSTASNQPPCSLTSLIKWGQRESEGRRARNLVTFAHLALVIRLAAIYSRSGIFFSDTMADFIHARADTGIRVVSAANVCPRRIEAGQEPVRLCGARRQSEPSDDDGAVITYRDSLRPLCSGRPCIDI